MPQTLVYCSLILLNLANRMTAGTLNKQWFNKSRATATSIHDHDVIIVTQTVNYSLIKAIKPRAKYRTLFHGWKSRTSLCHLNNMKSWSNKTYSWSVYVSFGSAILNQGSGWLINYGSGRIPILPGHLWLKFSLHGLPGIKSKEKPFRLTLSFLRCLILWMEQLLFIPILFTITKTDGSSGIWQ
jgi:hypothetical protein